MGLIFIVYSGICEITKVDKAVQHCSLLVLTTWLDIVSEPVTTCVSRDHGGMFMKALALWPL